MTLRLGAKLNAAGKSGPGLLETVRAAEALGYHSAWTYGSYGA